MNTHKQVEVNGIEVDEGLADLLANVWDAGIRTQFSCQGGDGERDGGMILFPTIGDAVKFITETLDRIDYRGPYIATYTERLKLHAVWPGQDSEGAWRATVVWPHQFTPVWAAAWSGTPMPLEDVLDDHCDVSIDELMSPDVEAVVAAGVRQYCSDLATEFAYHEPTRDCSLLDRFHDDAGSIARYALSDQEAMS